MLIEFSVSNYRSFREKQTFSMVAATRLRKKENVFRPVVDGERLPDLLKIAAIYGPNASGKSNLLRAMDVVTLVAKASPSTDIRSIPVTPFRFDKELATQPSRFEFNFVHKAQRYQFGFAATAERIVEERLIAFPRGKETLMYERLHLDTGDQYVFGDDLEGGKDLHQTWRKLTGPKSLFISQAVANSSEELNQLRTPFEWLNDGIVVVDDGMLGLARATQRLAKKNPEFAKEISSFLQDVDVPVTAMRFDTIHDSPSAQVDSGSALDDRVSAGLLSAASSKSKTTFTHKTALGEADFDFDEESEGTKGLIGFWLPWSLIVSKGGPFRLLAVDELDSSLHPEIVANLVKKHLQFEGPSQLIFTTHDTHLMDTKLLRRDQFWLTERDINGATQLRSIHEFDGRESEDIEKRYYEGRYRGLPVLRKR
jgi:energy-coupling factor transporter ATP-binding protein EcfA2